MKIHCYGNARWKKTQSFTQKKTNDRMPNSINVNILQPLFSLVVISYKVRSQKNKVTRKGENVR